ncbi:MAG: HU family DNA-binding protein [Proteobacteria bacterium]|nr:HU family DNA-binding protein [Pseudomonadota bacterium]
MKKARKAASPKALKKKAGVSAMGKQATAKSKKVNIEKKLTNTPISSTYSKSQMYSYIAEVTELPRKQVADVFIVLSNLASRHLNKKGVGEFVVPGLAKCVLKQKPATKARKGINPFTGEEMMFKAKPARNVVKIRPLKKLKEMVE